LGHGGYQPYLDPHASLSYTGHIPTKGGPIPHYTVRVRDNKNSHYKNDKRHHKLGLVQSMFQKGMDKITEKLLGVAEPVEYERPLYQEPMKPRYVEVRVPKCKDQIEVPYYITETLIVSGNML